MSIIQTHTGKFLDLFHPTPDMIDMEDIAHALAHLCRFTGHTNRFYSVAEHCVRMVQWGLPGPAALRLMHDATEAYIGDVSTPLKGLLPNYGVIELDIRNAIAERFGLERFHRPGCKEEVKEADRIMLAIERRDLLGEIDHAAWGELPTPPERASNGVVMAINDYIWPPEDAKNYFISLACALGVIE